MGATRHCPNSASDWKGFYEELQRETPRAAVIIAAAFLDVRLRELIANFLVDDPKAVDELLGSPKASDRPLSSFSSRISAAYCLGLLTKNERYDLHIIRKIRNKFAHGLHGLSMDDEQVAAWSDSLRVPVPLLEAAEHMPRSPSAKFLFSVSLLCSTIGIRALSIGKQRRTTPRETRLQYIRLSEVRCGEMGQGGARKTGMEAP